MITSWYNELRTTLNIDANIRSVIEMQREYVSKMANRTVAINKGKWQLSEAEPEFAPAQASTLVGLRNKLEKVTVPTFEGDVNDFYYFWKIFTKRVDNEAIDESEKFSLLLTHLCRKPLELVKNLQRHFNKDCKAEHCRRCSGQHHTFLCYKQTERRDSSSKKSNQGEENTIAFSAIKSSTKPFF